MGFTVQNRVYKIGDVSIHNVHPKDNPYRWMRRKIGTAQWIMAKDIGLTRRQLGIRERKKMFTVGELLALKQLCDLSNDQFIAMLEECA
ncbi:MAG: hypothetical protein EBR82_31880 [Caulobacteraceae bacterium]|nr:hypothetical protein [Caulobacteraceae bacterium]